MRIQTTLACALLALTLAAPAFGQAANQNPGPLEQAARPITADNPVPSRVQALGPDYPAAAAAVNARATVTLRIVIDQGGSVAESRLVAITAKGKHPNFSVNFTNAGLQDRDNLLALQLGKDEAALASQAIDALVQAAIDCVKGWRYEPPREAPIAVSVGFNFAPGMQPSLENLPASGELRRNAPDGAIRIGASIKPPAKIHHANPVYPKLAQSARVQGTVVIDARIERDGTVSHAQVLQSVPLLDEPALDAVLQWRFTPTLADGKPVPVIMTVTVAFRLQ